MRADGRPSGSTVASAIAMAARVDADASASHRSTSGSGSDGSASGSGELTRGIEAGTSVPDGGRACRPKSLLLARVVHLAEQHPALAVELGELFLLDRREVGRARVDLDARQQEWQLEVLDVRGLLHDVLARQVVAALLDHVRH